MAKLKYRDVFPLEVRNGYLLRLRLVRDETPSATGGAAPDDGPWHWVVNLEYQDHTRQAFNFPKESYPSEEERDEALRRVRAYVDGLQPGPRQMPVSLSPNPIDRR